MKKKILGLIAGIAILVLGGVIGSMFSGKSLNDGTADIADGGSSGYKVTATLVAEGSGSVGFDVEELITGKFGVNGTTADTITVVIPISVGKALYEQYSSGGLEGVQLGSITETGQISGEIKVVVSTPFGALTVMDRPFEYGTPTETKE
jgi:hypothetical protein